jgi:hypothetical protein
VKGSTTTEGFLFFKKKRKDNYEMKVDLVRRRRTQRLYLCAMLAKGKKCTESRELPQPHQRNQNCAQNCTQKKAKRRRSVVMGAAAGKDESMKQANE